nr:DDE-type integrase/transposase/recombinase [Actinomyces bowdenii]
MSAGARSPPGSRPASSRDCWRRWTTPPAKGWTVSRTCEVLGLDVRRARRWRRRWRANTEAGPVDAPPGASVNALTPSEVEAILEAFETFGDKDFSHRRLAHRGSCNGLFWVGPSTVRRVLNDHGLRFRHPPRPSGSRRRPFPDWATFTPNSIWIYDSTHFTACGMTVLIIEDLVSRKWITHIVSSEETHTQVRLAFEQALDAEGLLEAALERADALDEATDPDGDEELTPILLAVSDNGSQMISANTRKFMAMVAIAQHFGRPATPVTKRGSSLSTTRSSTSGLTCWPSPIPPSFEPSSTLCAPSTTPPVCTPASATSHPTTSTPVAAKPSARPAKTA